MYPNETNFHPHSTKRNYHTSHDIQMKEILLTIYDMKEFKRYKYIHICFIWILNSVISDNSYKGLKISFNSNFRSSIKPYDHY